jgi:hypothetical protein
MGYETAGRGTVLFADYRNSIVAQQGMGILGTCSTLDETLAACLFCANPANF